MQGQASSQTADPALAVAEPRPGSGWLARLVGRPAFWLLVVILAMAVPVLGQVLRPARPPLPVLGTLQRFSFTDQDGRGFGSDDLRGKVWLAGFIFTRCPTICPRLTETMAVVQKRARGLATDFRLVSFSVDPNFDTPAVLQTFAARYRVSPRMWKFLTGSLDDIRQTVEGGMKIAMSDDFSGDGRFAGDQDFASIVHGTHFVLVDRQMQIRGYYDSTDPDVVDRVLADATMLVNRGH